MKTADQSEQWWCDCRDMRGPHVHVPNWGGKGGAVTMTIPVDPILTEGHDYR